MSKHMDALAARRELLVARARLHRLELRHHASTLRRSLLRPMTALSVATSPAMRPLLLSVVMFAFGRGRASKLLRAALVVLAVTKGARALLGSRRRASGPQA